jgi:hypothetical protein
MFTKRLKNFKRKFLPSTFNSLRICEDTDEQPLPIKEQQSTTEEDQQSDLEVPPENNQETTVYAEETFKKLALMELTSTTTTDLPISQEIKTQQPQQPQSTQIPEIKSSLALHTIPPSNYRIHPYGNPSFRNNTTHNAGNWRSSNIQSNTTQTHQGQTTSSYTIPRNCQHQQNQQYQQHQPIIMPTLDLKIPIFSGDENPIRFFQRFENTLTAMQITDKSRWTYILGSHLSNQAEQFFFFWQSEQKQILVSGGIDNTTNFDMIKDEIISTFSTQIEPDMIDNKIESRFQQPGEPAQKYAFELIDLMSFKTPMVNQTDKIQKIIAKSRPDSLRDVNITDPKTIRDVIETLKRVDRSDRMLEQRRKEEMVNSKQNIVHTAVIQETNAKQRRNKTRIIKRRVTIEEKETSPRQNNGRILKRRATTDQDDTNQRQNNRSKGKRRAFYCSHHQKITNHSSENCRDLKRLNSSTYITKLSAQH